MPKYRGIGFTEKKLSDNVRARFIEHEGYFNRSGLYGNADADYPDNLERFAFFSRECLAVAEKEKFQPDVVHAHDWHTAMIPALLKAWPGDFFAKTKTLLTIHNLAYQGLFGAEEYPKLGLPKNLFSMDSFEFYGKVNLLKGGLLKADRLNAVSPGYAEEIKTKEFGCGLEGVLQKRKKRLSGILNGIDAAAWDPAKDARLEANYSADDLAGKSLCKAALQRLCRFEEDPKTPLFAVVSRLTPQKGLDLLAEAAPDMLSKKLQLVVLGDGDPHHRRMFTRIEKDFPKNSRMFLGFDAVKAHAIYAGSDFFLMPSLFEPCGLGQMIAMRYGAVPVVRATGGLKDTVTDAAQKNGNGFTFKEAAAPAFAAAVGRALEAYADPKTMRTLVATGMKADFSWDESAKKYETLYREAMTE